MFPSFKMWSTETTFIWDLPVTMDNNKRECWHHTDWWEGVLYLMYTTFGRVYFNQSLIPRVPRLCVVIQRTFHVLVHVSVTGLGDYPHKWWGWCVSDVVCIQGPPVYEQEEWDHTTFLCFTTRIVSKTILCYTTRIAGVGTILEVF